MRTTVTLTTLVSVFVSLLFLGDIWAASTVNTPILMLDEKLYFMTQADRPSFVKPGQYRIETTVLESPDVGASEKAVAWFRLTPTGDNRMDPVLIEANVASHKEELTRAEAYLMPTPGHNKHLKALILWYPNGTAFEAIVYKNAVFPRGGGHSWMKKATSMSGSLAKKESDSFAKAYELEREVYSKAKSAGRRIYKGAVPSENSPFRY